MIGRIHGRLLEKMPPAVLVDCAGVGYELDVPMSTLYQLPAVGEMVTLLTHLQVREDAHLLYGFATQAERATFRQLIKVSGIGARTALALLSGLSVEDLSLAVASQDGARLTKVPGIGKKTAERLLLELKGKLADVLPGALAEHAPGSVSADVLQALLTLGYSERDARAAMQKLAPDLSVTDAIRQALQTLAG